MWQIKLKAITSSFWWSTVLTDAVRWIHRRLIDDSCHKQDNRCSCRWPATRSHCLADTPAPRSDSSCRCNVYRHTLALDPVMLKKNVMYQKFEIQYRLRTRYPTSVQPKTNLTCTTNFVCHHNIYHDVSPQQSSSCPPWCQCDNRHSLGRPYRHSGWSRCSNRRSLDTWMSRCPGCRRRLR